MSTAAYRETYDRVPQDAKPALLALSVLISRIGSLPKRDQADFFELLRGMQVAEEADERDDIVRAMEEILAQEPITSSPVPLVDTPPGPGRKTWTEQVGRRIRERRDAAGMTQAQLAAATGLPQSHISRLERAEHSATFVTLQKIATALGVEVRDLDASSA